MQLTQKRLFYLALVVLLLCSVGKAYQASAQSDQIQKQTANTSLVAATYLGGGGTDRGQAVGLDAQGNIYIAGDTFSSTILGHSVNAKGSSDILVVKLSPDASQLLGFYSIGSSDADRVGGMAVTPQGEVILTINTSNENFPTKNALNPTMLPKNPGVLLKINAALDGLVFSTFTDFTVDNQQRSVAIDGNGNIITVGYIYNPAPISRDLVLEKYSANGQQQLYQKIWNNDTVSDQPHALLVQPDGTTYIAGYTDGWDSDFAVTSNAFQKVCGRKLALGMDHNCDNDAFIVRLNPAGDVTYASYLGGNGDDRAVGVGVDAQGDMYLMGSTSAPDFPTTAGALQPHCLVADPDNLNLCYYDLFISKLSADGSKLIYSSYLSSNDLNGLDYPTGLAVDPAGNATIIGFTASEQWPVKDAIQPALSAAPCINSFQDRLCFDSVITTLTPDGKLAFSTYLGGKGDEESGDIVLGSDGSIYLTGTTESLEFPATSGVIQPSLKAGADFFFAHIGSASTPPPTNTYRVYLPGIQH